jgi:hypothetical protein
MTRASLRRPFPSPHRIDVEGIRVKRYRQMTVVIGLLLVGGALGANPVLADGSRQCLTNNNFNVAPMGWSGGGAHGPTADNVTANIEVQTLNRCNGTDPDAKNGVFVYNELAIQDIYDVPFAYDGGTASRYGDYLRFGYYLCLWSGDSACGLGHGYFVSWSRRADAGCGSTAAIGIHRLGPVTTGYHSFKIDIQADESVKFLLDGSTVYTLASSATACWNRRSTVAGSGRSTAWDPGDQIGGVSSDYVNFSGFSVNGLTGEGGCFDTEYDGPTATYHCTDTGIRAWGFWTQG